MPVRVSSRPASRLHSFFRPPSPRIASRVDYIQRAHLKKISSRLVPSASTPYRLHCKNRPFHTQIKSVAQPRWTSRAAWIFDSCRPRWTPSNLVTSRHTIATRGLTVFPVDGKQTDRNQCGPVLRQFILKLGRVTSAVRRGSNCPDRPTPHCPLFVLFHPVKPDQRVIS